MVVYGTVGVLRNDLHVSFAPSLLRLSVGIENVDDIWMDLDAALKERG